MGYLDQEVMTELLEMEAVPACNTLSSLFGRSARIAVQDVSAVEPEALAEVLPHFNVVIEGMRSADGIEVPQMYIFDRSDIIRVANYIMGLPVESDSPLDEIALSTLKEVALQAFKAAVGELGDFLGRRIEGELSRATAYDSAERVCELIRLWKRENGLILIRFKVEIDGVLSADSYGVASGRLTEVFGLPAEADHPPVQEEESAGKVVKSKAVAVQEVYFPEFKYVPLEASASSIGEERKRIQDITLDVSVRVGGTVCSVKDILALKKGQILTLDKQAGSPADVVVNGQLVGRSDIMVMDDKFAARIIEIVGKRD